MNETGAISGLVGMDDLRSIVQGGPAPLFATISGAHLYGFPSPDSDIDLRGAFVLPLEAMLRLRELQETITTTCTCHDVEVDWVAHDVRKFTRLMTRRNGYVLEQLYSPLVVWGGAWLDELREIGRGCIVRHLYHHYRGFTNRQLNLLAKPDPSLKDLLYAYRVLLTGIHVLRTGEVEANLVRLNERFKLPGLDELAARKMAGAEKGGLPSSELETHRPQLTGLEAQLAEAFESSTLPDEPTTFQALDDYVVRARFELGHHE
jgi:predicted nucleotidyltransferase